jgi:hypothetical protein
MHQNFFASDRYEMTTRGIFDEEKILVRTKG